MSYLLDGHEYKAINRTVLAVVKKYITENPEITYQELKKVFPDNLQGSTGVIKNKIDYEEFLARTSTGDRRFFKDNILKIKDDDIYVCTEWGDDGRSGKGNIRPFISYTNKRLNYGVKII